MYMSDTTREDIADIIKNSDPLDPSEVQGDIKPAGVE